MGARGALAWSSLATVATVVGLSAALSAGPGVPTFEEVVQKLAGVNASLQSFQVDQVVDLRVLFLRYRLSTTVYAARPAKYRVVVHDPPWFLRQLGSVFTQVGRPEDLLAQYVARRVEWRGDAGGRLYLHITRRSAEVNPPNVEASVDAERWLVESMLLHYDWGDVRAEYRYGIVAGYLLPSVITVRVPRYLAEAVLVHEHYQLNVAIAASVFADR